MRDYTILKLFELVEYLEIDLFACMHKFSF